MVLLLSTDFDDLPSDPKVRWLKLRDLLEKRLRGASHPEEGASNDDLIEYCAILSAAADKLEVGSLEAVSVGNIRRDYETFRASVISLATRLSLDTASISYNEPMILTIKASTKEKISGQIEVLRSNIRRSDLPAEQKKILEEKLDELYSLVLMPRTNGLKVMAILAFIGAIVMETTSFLSDAPAAIGTITALIGTANEENEPDIQLLQKENEPLKLPNYGNGKGLDDEIPF